MKTLTLLAIALILGAVAGAADLARGQQHPADAAPPPPPRQQQGPQARPTEPRRGPPPEALAACKALAAGAACSFSTPRGAERGSCWAPEGRPLACRPNDRSPPPSPAAPPPRPPAPPPR